MKVLQTLFCSLREMMKPRRALACLMSLAWLAAVSVASAETETFTTAGTSTWTAPTGVTSVTVEAWGGGGAGGGATSYPAQGGGGAGGQYAKKVVTVTPGKSYKIVVGAGATGDSGNGSSGGDSTFATSTVVAKGGAGGGRARWSGSVGSAGAGSASNGVGDIVYAGGSGSAGSLVAEWSYYVCAGGAGGGGAGSSGAGGSASGVTAGTGTSSGGGNGGAGLEDDGHGNSGSSAGGGGSGGCGMWYTYWNGGWTGGDGGTGKVALTYNLTPKVSSITRASTNPTSPYTSVSWTVVFDLSVTGVDSSDFSLIQTGGATGASITSVSGSGTTWTVTAYTGTSSTGTLGLNLVDDDSIVGSSSGIKLGGTGTGNGNYTGEVYTLQAPGPTLAKTASTSSASLGDVITFTITVSNPLSIGLTNVVVTDTLPTGMTYSTSVAGSGSVSQSGQVVTWAIPSLAAGASATLTLAVSLSAKGTLTNTVTAPNATSASATVLVLASAITHFKMDETVGAWSGKAGEVIDSGGNALHGQRLTTTSPTTTNTIDPSPTIASEHSSVVGGFCNAGYFDGNAVVKVADSSKFDYTTKLSASAWIYPTALQSELSSILSNDVNYEFHLNSSSKLYWWWNSSSLTSAKTIPLNQWTHVAITFSSAFGAGRQKIYIDGVEDTNTNNWTGTLAANACPFYIGGDISTGSSCSLLPARNFKGRIDEVKLYDYELSADEVLADMNLGRSCSGAFDHIRIEHDGVASICAPETVTIKACLNSSCTTLYTGSVTVNLSPSGWVGGDTLTFTGGVTSHQLSYGTAGNVALGTNSVSPTPANSTRCFNGSTETCTMNFASASCNFDAVETSKAPQTNIYTKLAGVPFNLDVLALTSTTTVNTSYTGTVSVDLVDASSSACPTGTGLNTATSITYATSDAGRKSVAFNYANAARNVRVRAKVGSSTPACSSDSFAIRPSSFSSVASSANADSTGASATATPTVKAGASFTLTANTGVVGYDGSPVADASLTEWANVPTGGRASPGTGVLDGTTSGDLSFSTAASATTGNGASGTFTYDDAGYFRFKAYGVYDSTFVAASGDKANGDCIADSFSNTLSSGKYGCNVGNQTATDYFGRFIPDHFNTAVTQACADGGFTYSGQPFPLTVTALNLAGGTTQNYSGGYSKAISLIARDAADTSDNPGPGAWLSSSLDAGSFTAGIVSFTPTYTFTSKETAPTSIVVRVSDGEVSSLRSPSSLSVEGTAVLRGGRARLSNAYGSELLDLPVVFRAEYWNGSGWVLNKLDSCTGNTTLDSKNAVSVTLASAPAALATCVRDSGNPGLSGAGCATATTSSTKRYIEGAATTLGFAGDFNLWLQAPKQFGATTITATVPSWLGSSATAKATFGRYKSPVIYRREVY